MLVEVEVLVVWLGVGAGAGAPGESIVPTIPGASIIPADAETARTTVTIATAHVRRNLLTIL
jgi:hypothetical protein